MLLFSPFYYGIIANRGDHLVLKFSLFNAIANASLCLLLIPKFGIIGAALSMMFSDITNSILSAIYFNKINQLKYN